MGVHFTNNYPVVSHQIAQLPLIFADGTLHMIEFLPVLVLNYATILRMPFLYKYNPVLICKTKW